MKRSKLAVFLIAAIAICAMCTFALDAAERADGSDDGGGNDTIVILEKDPAEVSQVSVTFGGETCGFFRNGGTWEMIGNPDFPVWQERVERIAGALAPFNAVQAVDTGEANMEEFGLETPLGTASFTCPDGTYAYNIGGFNTILSCYYINPEGSREVYLVKEYVVDKFLYTLEDFVAVEALPQLEYGEIRAIAVDANGKTIEVRKNQTGVKDADGVAAEWEQRNDESVQWLPAGTGSVKDAVSHLFDSTLYFKQCAFYEPDEECLEACGLTQPSQITIEYQTDTAGKGKMRLSLGATDGNGNLYVLFNGCNRVVYLLDEERAAPLLAMEENMFAVTEVCRIPIDEVRHIKVERDGGICGIMREPMQEGPGAAYYVNGKPAAAADVVAFYTALLNLTAERIDRTAKVPDGECEFSISIEHGLAEDLTVLEFYRYDNDYYLVAHNGKSHQLVNRISISNLLSLVPGEEGGADWSNFGAL